jgi:hypothetical protein
LNSVEDRIHLGGRKTESALGGEQRCYVLPVNIFVNEFDKMSERVFPRLRKIILKRPLRS